MILTVVEDLIFLSKIQQTAKALSIAIGPAGIADAASRLREGAARGLLVDLNHRSGRAVELIAQLKADPTTAGITVVGFVSHVQADLAASARAAGCDMLLARSAFVKQLPQLLTSLDGEKSEPAAPTT